MRLMPLAFALFVALITSPARGDPDRVRKLLESDLYTVTWDAPAAVAPAAVLEVGYGSGHGGSLTWLRFQPGKDGVDILSIRLDKGRKAFYSKWPPDTANVSIQRGRLPAAAYGDLLRDLAIVAAAQVKVTPKDPAAPLSFSMTSNDFWVSTRLLKDQKPLLDLDWCGYEGSREAIQTTEWKDGKLTEAERQWASRKFARDWKAYADKEFYWWVCERSIITVGVVGDRSAVPLLLEILTADAEIKSAESPRHRRAYYAINAITRLTGKDLREKPVEEMDLAATRRKVLEAMKDEK
jgi:hypothetical protein